jgi:hypothetical protein
VIQGDDRQSWLVESRSYRTGALSWLCLKAEDVGSGDGRDIVWK